MAKITENNLRQVIREERSKILTESDLFNIVLEETIVVLREQDLEDKAEKVARPHLFSMLLLFQEIVPKS